MAFKFSRFGLWIIAQIFIVSMLYVVFIRVPTAPKHSPIDIGDPDHSKHGHTILSEEEEEITELKLDFTLPKLKLREEKHDKWIVITSIHYPTEAIQFLASLKEWKVLVVGDTKSPKDFNYPGVRFLDIEEQLSLGYQTTKLIPFRSYARKNIGYLYAIQHGAKIIYETDDDNQPNTNEIFYIEENAKVSSYVANQRSLNIYEHFGEPTIWPRGYPLNDIHSKIKQIETQPTNLFVPVQQGLANLDPDVDAIFRLTRKLNITFAKNSPIAIPKGAFCPYNTQNTLYFNSAFWGLLVPITTAFRVCDIWRSYWAQRLLWDIGANLAFVHATVDQIRNVHDYLLDFEDELDLYLKADKFVDFLGSWTSDAPTLPGRMMELMKLMVQKKFFKRGDYDLMKAWIEDLIAMDYEFPPIAPKPFAYLVQSEKDLPVHLKEIKSVDADVFLLSWKEKPSDTNSVTSSLFQPGTSWNQGRNLLMKRAMELEKAQGWKYKYFIFLDEDAKMIHNPPSFNSGSPWRVFEQWLLDWEPAVGIPILPPLETEPKWMKGEEKAMYHFDAMVNAIHRDALEHLLPYDESFDNVCWWVSQWKVVSKAAMFYKNHVLVNPHLITHNEKHRRYPREKCFAQFEKVTEDMRSGKDSSIPSDSRKCLESWSEEIFPKMWGTAKKKETRSYDDIQNSPC